MSFRRNVSRVNELVKLHGDEAKHEQTDSWANRDLIPLPPSRRTWGWFEFFGYWTLNSLNVSVWQLPNTFLSAGLSVKQSMAVIVVSNVIITMFTSFCAWCGLTYHIGFTIQNRYSWGMRGSYIPLIQRVMLNFIWTAIQCYTGGLLTNVIITAVWPSFQDIPNHLPASANVTTQEMVGFFIFWFCSLPFLWLPPEKFRLPFLVTSIYCSLGMISLLIWSLAVAKGVGPLFTQGTNTTGSRWTIPWIMLNCINSNIGSTAAGMVNGSDFSRYGKSKSAFIIGTISCLFAVGIIVSFMGLVVTSAAQNIYGEIYWNPPDLLMRIMGNGRGSAKSRVACFFLALGFALTSGFQNVCGNAVAGGIDLAGMFPRYINIRRGAILTFLAAWIVQPWQLEAGAATFLTALSSFSVFLAPMMGIMTADFFLLRRGRIALSHLFRLEGSAYYYALGFNLRALPAWLAGWAPTVGGLNAAVHADDSAPRALYELYYVSFFIGFFISFSVFLALNVLFPPGNLDTTDDADVYGAFTASEARALGLVPAPEALDGEPELAYGEAEKVAYGSAEKAVEDPDEEIKV
ncbi:permease for cytosine/purines, uracil, thiamine, allantoin-domain-containing protein [Vararia minispora EC-137]|uniref:Permease for cytosine/purines, uracil, thiamine, allantoin-domain-containing protein n=1 Tax=Vararia minispora EC-137 TaxID=1314806 RepID=A0ACB8QDK1_9AGAM|nr:permease for cytosine/purines, uracil, thiamine, allantoin-domain-containing protein [Vararia minispora EC-137]